MSISASNDARAQILLGDFTQATRLLRLSTPLGAQTLLAECVRGEEGLNQGYAFQIAALSGNAGIALRSLIGQPALLELLTAGDGQARPFHGHLTAVELAGANGGFARYHLTLEPWTAFLAHGRDSRVFQDMTVFDILDHVFGAYRQQGKLAPAWHYDILQRDSYAKRSLCIQYQESDLAFCQRLMSEEGLFYYFTHHGDVSSAALGKHTLVIADHNGAFPPNPQANVQFTQPGAVMKADSMDRWRTEWRQQTNAIELGSWDYRSLDMRPVGAASPDAEITLASRDTPGAYAYPTPEHGQRIAERQLQALEAAREVHIGAGTVRTMAPGTIFTLQGQAQLDQAAGDDGRSFLVVRVIHLMHNNLSAQLQASVQPLLGRGLVDLAIGKERDGWQHQPAAGIAERPLYRNRIDAIRASTPYRGAVKPHPRPTIHGQQSAIVVGPPGSVVHTDRDHRIKLQFHWQRGEHSHSQMTHPRPDGHSGAPGDDSAGTWVRVATSFAPVAGANWGGNTLPRVGQEVLVDFLEGDIDRPVVIGTLYNGRGNDNAPHNQVARGAGAASGNAPAWFPGTAGAHAHAATLSGIKSQAMASSADGGGAYSQLVFDDSAGQARLALQRHAATHQGTAELNLGHLVHQSDNQRVAEAGFGAELKSANSVALRAGKGILLSSDARDNASGAQMDSREAQAQLEHSLALQTSLAGTAQKHKAAIAGKDQAQAEPEPARLPAIAQLAQGIETLKTNASEGPATAYDEARLQLSSPAGIAATTPANAILAAGNTGAITAGQDINFGAQGNQFYAIKTGISLFTYGKANNAGKPNQETGIRLHAASGKLGSQSQSDETRLTADKAVTVASVAAGINVAAKNHVLMTAQGAYLRLEGGNIMLHGPGKIEFKASLKEWAGPASASPVLPHLPNPADSNNFLELNYRWDDMQPMVGAPYLVKFADGTSLKGKLDAKGHARLEHTPDSVAVVTYGEDERAAVPRRKQEANQVYGARARSEEEAQAILATYMAQEEAYYNDNFFPDELDEMAADPPDADGAGTLDYDFHHDDYRYADEDSEQEQAEEKDYRQAHDHEGEHDGGQDGDTESEAT